MNNQGSDCVLITYYYSQYNVFDEQIIYDLLWCQSFLQNISKELSNYSSLQSFEGGFWRHQLGECAYQIQSNKYKRFLQQEYIYDILTYSWMILRNQQRSKLINFCETNLTLFKSIVFSKLTGFIISNSSFARLLQTLLFSIQYFQNISMLLPKQQTTFTLSYMKKLKLIAFQNSTLSIQNIIQCRLCQSLFVQESFMKRKPHQSMPENQQQGRSMEEERCQSDIQDIVNREKLKTKQLKKTQEKNLEIIRDQIKEFPTPQITQWKPLRQFMVAVFEISQIEAIRRVLKENERVRIIAPVKEFYRDSIQVWVVENVKQIDRLEFNEYLIKIKHFFGSDWKDEWKIPLFEVYRLILQLMNSQQMVDQLQLIAFLVQGVSNALEQKWIQSIQKNPKFQMPI